MNKYKGTKNSIKPTSKNVAAFYGMTVNALNIRLCRGANPVDAVFNYATRNKDELPLFVCKWYKRHIDIDVDRVYLRAFQGFSPKRALTQEVKERAKVKRNRELHTWQGEEWTLRELASHLNIPYMTLHCRLNKYGFTLEDAIATPIVRGAKPTKTVYVADVAKALDLDVDTLNGRLKLGWSLERAIKTPMKQSSGK
jgi:hypothetical protein